MPRNPAERQAAHRQRVRQSGGLQLLITLPRELAERVQEEARAKGCSQTKACVYLITAGIRKRRTVS